MTQFNPLAAKKILQTAKRGHNTTKQRDGVSTPALPSNDDVLGKLVSVTNRQWAWKQVRRKQDGTYEDVTNGVIGTANDRYGFEFNGRDGGKAGDVYPMRRTQVKKGNGDFETAFGFTIGGSSSVIVYTGFVPAGYGAGKYPGIICTPTLGDDDPSTPLTMNHFQTAGGEQCICWNLYEIQTGTNFLTDTDSGVTAGSGVTGMYQGTYWKTNADGKKVIILQGLIFGDCQQGEPPDDENYNRE